MTVTFKVLYRSISVLELEKAAVYNNVMRNRNPEEEYENVLLNQRSKA